MELLFQLEALAESERRACGLSSLPGPNGTWELLRRHQARVTVERCGVLKPITVPDGAGRYYMLMPGDRPLYDQEREVLHELWHVLVAEAFGTPGFHAADTEGLRRAYQRWDGREELYVRVALLCWRIPQDVFSYQRGGVWVARSRDEVADLCGVSMEDVAARMKVAIGDLP